MHHIKVIKDGNVNKVVKEQLVDGVQYVDNEPREGSLNGITSDAVSKVAGDVGDVKDLIPEGTTEENPLVNETVLGEVAERVTTAEGDIDSIEEKIPSGASSSNKLVTESDLEAAQDSWQSGFTPKGEATVSQINALTTQSNGYQYIVTDSGTITSGSVAVVAGDTVAWDSENEVWYKVTQYAKASEQAVLTTYAQKIAHNFAGGFDPNKDGGYTAGDIVIYNGVLKKFVQNHSGAWSDAYARDADLNNYNILNATNYTGSAPFNDLDTYPDNRLCVVTSNYSSIAHKPEEQGFFVITQTPKLNSVKFQFLISGSRKIYTRCKWESWSAWKELTSSAIINKGALSATQASSSPYDDLNTYPINEVVLCVAPYTSVAHKPIEDEFNVLTFGGSSSARCQILSTETKRLFARCMWASVWGPWFELREPEEFVNPLLAFDNIVCIGDSLTYSQVYTGADTSRQAKKTYPQMLATLCGNSQETLAVSGATAITSWAMYKDSLVSKTNALAIVYLGTNGGLTDTLDTDAPAADDPSTWADTNTGCYAKYVQKLQSLGYKVLLIKPWVSSGNLTTTNLVISQIGTRFGAAVLEPFHTSDTKYHYYPDLSGSNSIHYNDLGYAWFASMLLTKVAKLDNSQMKYLIPS